MPPVVVYRPKFILQPLDEAGDPDGAAVEVSEDVETVEIDADQEITRVKTFAGSFAHPGDVEPSATISAVVGTDTAANWAPLLGVRCQAQVYDRLDATTFRAFETQIDINPALYGATTPGEARTFDFEIPVLSAVTIEAVPVGP
jgi:hypothetical protein